MRRNRRQHCNCPKQIIYPVKNNVIHCCSEETVKHIHPSHTTIMNHHLVKNEHVYPHSTSIENTFDEVNINAGGRPPFGGAPGNQVAGVMNQPSSTMGQMNPGQQHGNFQQNKHGSCCGYPPHSKPNHFR